MHDPAKIAFVWMHETIQSTRILSDEMRQEALHKIKFEKYENQKNQKIMNQQSKKSAIRGNRNENRNEIKRPITRVQ